MLWIDKQILNTPGISVTLAIQQWALSNSVLKTKAL